MARVKIFGTLPVEAAVVVGSWDPLLLEHEEGLGKLAAKFTSSGQNGTLVPILLDPSPGVLLNGNRCPRFECAEARVALLADRKIDGVIKLSLSKADCEQGVEWLLEFLSVNFLVKSLLVHSGQTLGPGGCGDPWTIKLACKSRGIKLFDSGIFPTPEKMRLFKLYAKNVFPEITSALGRYLTWKVRRDRPVVPLPPGRYRIRVAKKRQSLDFDDCQTGELFISPDGFTRITNSIASSFWLAIVRWTGDNP